MKTPYSILEKLFVSVAWVFFLYTQYMVLDFVSLRSGISLHIPVLGFSLLALAGSALWLARNDGLSLHEACLAQAIFVIVLSLFAFILLLAGAFFQMYAWDHNSSYKEPLISNSATAIALVVGLVTPLLSTRLANRFKKSQ